MIPRIIYSTWISDKPIPDKFKKYIESWSRVNPDYQIHIISLDNVKHGPFVDKAISIGNYALAGHYARVQELYDTGGIYVDIDVECNNPFDPLLNHELILGMEDNNVVNNAVMLSVAGHQFLRECMDYMDAFPFDSEKIELATGPIMFTKIAKRRGWRNGVAGTFKGVTILTPPHFYPYRYDQFFTKECITEKTFCIHHWANSWNDKVSIIIPCYKQAQFLPDAIESALAQTYKDIEVIVVNDGSPDNTSQVAKRYPVKLIEQTNKGLSAARNAGIKKSAGGWIVTLDADDKIDPEYVSKLIKRNDIVSCTLKTFGNENRVWKSPKANPEHKDFLIRNHIHCCSIFKKDVWTLTGGYDENMKLGFEDWDFWTRATKEGFGVTCVDEPLFLYRKHASPSMVDQAKRNQRQIISYMKSKHVEERPQLKPIVQKTKILQEFQALKRQMAALELAINRL